MSLVSQYEDLCKGAKAQPNSKVIHRLKHTDTPVTALDLSSSHLGDEKEQGSRPLVLVLLQSLSTVKSVDFSKNHLPSSFTTELLNAVASHPSLESIDLSDNDLRLGGQDLVELATRNPRLLTVNVENCHIRSLYTKLLDVRLEKNAKGGSPGDSDKASSSSNRPTFMSSGGDERGSRGGDDSDSNSLKDDDDASPFGGWGDGGKKFGGDDGGEPFSFGSPAGDDEKSGDDDEQDDDVGAAARKAADADAMKNFRRSVANESAGVPKVPRRRTISSEVYEDSDLETYKVPVHSKTEEESKWLLALLERHDLFAHLEDADLHQAVLALAPVEKDAGDTVYTAGEEDVDHFYILYNGTVEIHEKDGNKALISRGKTFRDESLMFQDKPSESAICTAVSVLYTLERQTYKTIVAVSSKKKRALYEEFLMKVPFLKKANLSKTDILQLADSLKSVSYEPGDTLIRYGDIGESFFIIAEGTVDVWGRSDEGEKIRVCTFTVGENVGELEFLRANPCVADVKAQTFVRVAKMTRHHFELVMGPVKEVLRNTAQDDEVFSYYRHQVEKIEKEGFVPQRED